MTTNVPHDEIRRIVADALQQPPGEAVGFLFSKISEHGLPAPSVRTEFCIQAADRALSSGEDPRRVIGFLCGGHERWLASALKSLVDAAVDLVEQKPPGERFQYAETLLHGDKPLVTEVHRRLLVRPAAGTSEAESMPGEGAIIDNRFELIEVLGKGGFGEVWKAFDRKNNNAECAVKLLRDSRVKGAAPTESQRRFESECERLRVLVHRRVARYIEHGLHSEKKNDRDVGRPYLAMHYVGGASLIKTANNAKLSTRERVELMREALTGIRALHDRGIIHRDIKPANIVVGSEGPVVVDLGLSLDLKADSAARVTGDRVPGTTPYVAPECREGQDATETSDVYSCGVTLIELLTGKLPADEPSLSDIKGDRRAARRRLWNICLAATAASPSQRLGSVEMLRDQLNSWMLDYNSEDTSITQTPEGRYHRELVRRWRRGSVVLGVAVLVMIAALAFAQYQHEIASAAQEAASELEKQNALTLQEKELATKQADITAELFGMLLTNDDPFRQPLRPGDPSMEEVAKGLERYYKQHVASLTDQQRQQVVRGLAIRYEQIGDYKAAIEWNTAWLVQLGGEHAPASRDLAAIYASLGRCELRLGRAEPALAALHRSLDVLQQAAPADEIARGAIKCEVADSLVLRSGRGDLNAAVRFLDEAESDIGGASDSASDRLASVETADVLAHAAAVRARVLARTQSDTDTDAAYEEALVKMSLTNEAALIVSHSRVNYLNELSRFDDAVPLAELVVKGFRTIYKKGDRRIVDALLALVKALRGRGHEVEVGDMADLNRALEVWKEANELVRRASQLETKKSLSTNVARFGAGVRLSRGERFRELEKPDEAREEFRHALQEYRYVINNIEERQRLGDHDGTDRSGDAEQRAEAYSPTVPKGTLGNSNDSSIPCSSDSKRPRREDSRPTSSPLSWPN